jgi:gamma-glutamylputrescine oxidase
MERGEMALDRRKFLKTSAGVGAGAALGAWGLNELSPAIFREHPVFDTNQSLWMRNQPPHNPPLTADLDVEVAVIGGGFTGLSSAYHIAQGAPGKSVVVLEAKGVGNGASGRNGGMLLPNTANEYMQVPSTPEVHKEVYGASLESMQELVALAKSSAVEGAVEPVGALETLETEREAEKGRAYAEKARGLGIPAEFWDGRKTAAAIGTAVYTGALFDPNGGHVHPMKLVHVLKLAAENAGARIYEDSPVESIEEGGVHRIHMSDGQTVKAKSLVLATNAYTSKLGYFRNAIVPVYNYVAATPPLSGKQLSQAGWQSRMPFNDSRTLVYYLGMTRDNRIHIGGGTAAYSFNDGTGERPDPRAWKNLQEQFVRLFPALQGVEFETRWSGVVDMTLDWAPLVGVTGKNRNVYYGLGYCGHGVNLTFLFGRIIADLEANRAQKWSHLPFVNRKPCYLPNEPFRWLGVQLEMAYDRLKDR